MKDKDIYFIVATGCHRAPTYASGVSVVKIDNGFGAAYNASIINHL